MFRRALGDDSMSRVRGGVNRSHQKYKQSIDYTEFRSRVGGDPELTEFDISDLVEQLEFVPPEDVVEEGAR